MPRNIITLISKVLFYLFTGLLSLSSVAQESCKTCKPYNWEVGLPIGINQYFGDMYCCTPYASANKIMSGAFVRRYINDYIILRGQILLGNLAGNDLTQPNGRWDYRRLYFFSPLAELSFLGEIYPLKEKIYTSDGIFRKTYKPYFFGGVGIAFTNPVVGANWTNEVRMGDDPRKYVVAKLFDQDQANLKKVALILPFGAGIKYSNHERSTIGLEVGYRYAFSDYLDGTKLSTTALGTGTAFEPNGKSYNDGYLVASISFSYRFGDIDTDKDGVVDKCDKCPRIKGDRIFEGCPDSDGDGIYDKVDICPDDFGDPATCGCPDDDSDGIPNSCDCCPNERGSRETHGCSEKNIIHSYHVKVTSSQKLCSLCPEYLPLAIRK